jgi:RimJ/RimL family protein N-acetyltransferase
MIAAVAPPTIKTPRLTLRGLNAADAGPMTRLANDPDLARMTTGIPHPYDTDQARAFIDRVQASDPRRGPVLAIEQEGDGFMGLIGFHPTLADWGLVWPELGYWLGRPFWGQGFMTEAVRAAMAWVAREWRRPVIASGHFTDNDASGRVLIKAGFLYTGQVTPRFSLARDAEAATRMMIWLA